MTRLNVQREGQGPIVVLSHALGCDLHMWDEVAERLRGRFTVLRYDHRGHGRSAPIGGAVSIEDFARDAAGLIREEAGGQRVHFVGLSMGGMTAQALAAAEPALLASVVIANSSAWYADKAPWLARVETVQAKGVAAIADGAVARWLTPEFVATPAGAAVAQRLRDVLVATDPADYAASCRAIAELDLREGNRGIAVPTLVVAGRRDEATPPAMSKDIAGTVPGAKHVEIDAAHLSAPERPDDFVRALEAFWAGT